MKIERRGYRCGFARRIKRDCDAVIPPNLAEDCPGRANHKAAPSAISLNACSAAKSNDAALPSATKGLQKPASQPIPLH